MIPTPIKAAQSLLAIHHHHDDGTIYYKQTELIPLLTSWGITPDWDGCAKEHAKFEKMLREMYLVTHPGECLKETIDEMGMTIQELAEKIKQPVEYVESIINCEMPITAGVAEGLEKVLEIDRHYWHNRQKLYYVNMIKAHEQYNIQEASNII